MKDLKRVVAMIIALATLSTVGTTTLASAENSQSTNTFYTGDVNLDGIVNVVDLLTLKKEVLGVKELSKMYLDGDSLKPVVSEQDTAQRNVGTFFEGNGMLEQYVTIHPEEKYVVLEVGENLTQTKLNITDDTTIKESGEVKNLDYLTKYIYQADYNYLTYIEYDTDTNDIITLDVIPYNAQNGLVTLYGQFYGKSYDMEVDTTNSTISVPQLGITLPVTDETSLSGIESLEDIYCTDMLCVTYDLNTMNAVYVSYSEYNIKLVLTGTVIAVDDGKATVKFTDGFTQTLDINANVGDTVVASSYGDDIGDDWFETASIVVIPQATETKTFYTGDVNLDGNVDAVDLLSLKKMVLGVSEMQEMYIDGDTLKLVETDTNGDVVTILANGYSINKDAKIINIIDTTSDDRTPEGTTLTFTDDTTYSGNFSSFEELVKLVASDDDGYTTPVIFVTYNTLTNEVISCEQVQASTQDEVVTILATGYSINKDAKTIYVDGVDSELNEISLYCTDSTTYSGNFSNFEELFDMLDVYETHPSQSDPVIYITYNTLTNEVISCEQVQASYIVQPTTLTITTKGHDVSFDENSLSVSVGTEDETVDPIEYTITDSTTIQLGNENITFEELKSDYQSAKGYVQLEIEYYYDETAQQYEVYSIKAYYIDSLPTTTQSLSIPSGSQEYKVEYIDSENQYIAINSIYLNEYEKFYADKNTTYSDMVSSFEDLEQYKDGSQSVMLTSGECVEIGYTWTLEYYTESAGKNILTNVKVSIETDD